MKPANDARQSADHDPTNGAAAPKSAAGEPPRRKARWRRRILVFLGILVPLLIILVALAPFLLSTGLGRDLILSMANKRLQGTVAVNDLSLSWFGQCGAQGLKVSDPQGREVLHVDSIKFAGGVWHAMSIMKRLEQVTVDTPQVILYVSESGDISLAQAFGPRTPPTTEEESGPVSIPEGAINVRGGNVRVIRADGREYEVANIDVEASLDSTGGVQTKLQMALANGGKLKGEIEVSKLLSNGQVRPSNADGKFHIYSDESINVGPIVGFALNKTDTVGEVELDVKGTVQAGTVAANVVTNLVGTGSSDVAGRRMEPTNLRLSGTVQASAEEVTGQLDLKGDAGQAQAELAYAISDPSVTVSADQLRAALLDGEALELPQFTVKGQASLDLPTLEKVLPGLLHVRANTEITGGKLELTDLDIKGGAEPSATATVELSGLAAKTSGGDVHLKPIAANVDVLIHAGQGLEVRRARLESGFGHVVASGTAAKLRATIDGDLQALQQQIGQLFDLGSVELAGDLFAEVEVSRTQGEDLDFNMDLTAERLRYRKGENELTLQLATLNNQGAISLTARERPRIEITNSALNLDGRVQAETSGWYDLEADAFHVEAELKQADLDFVGRQVAALGVSALSGCSGVVQLQGRIDRASRDAAIVSEGNVLASNIQVDGEPLTEDLRCRWSDVQFSPAAQSLSVQLAELESAIAGLTVQEANARFGAEMTIDGRVEGKADLARCATVAARLAKSGEPPAVSGQLAFKTVCRSDDAGFAATGDGSIADFVVSTGTASPKEQLQFAYDATLNHKDRKVSLRKLDIASGLVSTQVTGEIEQYDTVCSLALTGQYEIAWQRVTKVLHELVPATAETIALTGTTSGKLQASGPLHQPEARPTFRDLSVGLDLGWNSAEVYGVPLGQAALSPALASGELKLPQTAISVADGFVRLGGSVDFRPDTPTLRIPGKLTVLKDIKITPQLGKQLLGRINPVFSQATRVEGIVGLAVQDLNLPLGEAMTQGGNGTGRLDLKDTKMQPGGLLGTLGELGGMGASEMYTVRFSGLDLTVTDGRIHYKDFTMTFADNAFDLVFYGSVGFDDTLDLVVSIPVRQALLKRLGVKGPVAEYAKKLSNTRVDLPIVGTRGEPKLDFAKVDVKKLLQDVLKEGLLDKSGLLDKEGSKNKGKEPKGGKSKDDKDGLGGLLDKLPSKSEDRKKSGDGA